MVCEGKPHENAFEVVEPPTTKAGATSVENGRERQSGIDRVVKRKREKASKREKERQREEKGTRGPISPRIDIRSGTRSGSFSCQAVDNESRSFRREATRSEA